LTAYSCICWLFHRIYYDARNHKHKIIIIIIAKVFAVFCLAYSFNLRVEAVTSPETFANCCIFEWCYIPEDGKFQPSHCLSGTIFDVSCTQKSLSLSLTVLSASLFFWTVTRQVIRKGHGYPTSGCTVTWTVSGEVPPAQLYRLDRKQLWLSSVG